MYIAENHEIVPAGINCPFHPITPLGQSIVHVGQANQVSSPESNVVCASTYCLYTRTAFGANGQTILVHHSHLPDFSAPDIRHPSGFAYVKVTQVIMR